MVAAMSGTEALLEHVSPDLYLLVAALRHRRSAENQIQGSRHHLAAGAALPHRRALRADLGLAVAGGTRQRQDLTDVAIAAVQMMWSVDAREEEQIEENADRQKERQMSEGGIALPPPPFLPELRNQLIVWKITSARPDRMTLIRKRYTSVGCSYMGAGITDVQREFQR